MSEIRQTLGVCAIQLELLLLSIQLLKILGVNLQCSETVSVQRLLQTNDGSASCASIHSSVKKFIVPIRRSQGKKTESMGS